MRTTGINFLKSEKACSLGTIGCGIVIMIGLYLPWGIVPLYDSYTLTLSGWRLIIWSESLGETFIEPYFTMFGGVVMLACGLSAFILSVVAGREREMKKALVIGFSVGAALAIVGALWFIISALASGGEGSIGYGLYLCAVSAVLGLVLGIRMFVRVHRSSVADIERRRFRIVGPLITLASGTVMLLGVFLPWISQSAGGVTSSISGWALTRFDLTGASNPEPLLVMAGSILMILCGILLSSTDISIIKARTSTLSARNVFWALGAIVYTGGALSVSGTLWFVIPATGDIGTGSIGYGVYILLAASIVGVIFGIRTCAQSIQTMQTTQTSRVGL
jgi:hypothetical protein